MDPEQLMQMMMAHEMGGSEIEGISMDDPDMIDWGVVQREFGLSDEELAELQVVAPPEGRSMRDRLEGMRPNMNIGPMELTVDGSVKEPRIEGRLRF